MTEDMKKAIQEECAFEDLIWYNLQEINSMCIKKNSKISNIKNIDVDTITNTIVYQSITCRIFKTYQYRKIYNFFKK